MPASTSPSWAPLLPAALAGTRRQGPPALPTLTPSLGTEASAAEKQLLLTAANLALVRRAGQRPLSKAAPSLPPPPLPETWPAVAPAALRHLEALLALPPDETEEEWQAPVPARLLALVLADLHRAGRRLPPRTVLHLLRHHWAAHLDPAIARPVLGEWGQWLFQQLGSQQAPGYTRARRRHPAGTTPQQRYDYLLSQGRYHLFGAAAARYEAELALVPAEQHAPLLWHSWQATGGNVLPPAVQQELDALLAATPPAQWPWSNAVYQLQGRVGTPRLANHPQLTQLTGWLAPLLVLERQPGQLPRVRVTPPTAWNEEWQAAGFSPRTAHFNRRSEREEWLQQLLCALGPRYWADRWQLPPAEVVALVAAAERGQLVLDAWALALQVSTPGYWADPEFARVLLPTQRALLLPLRGYLVSQLPLAEQLTWVAAILPTDLAAPHEPEWAAQLQYWNIPVEEPAVLRPLLPVLAAALAQPRTPANARQCAELPNLLHALVLRVPPAWQPEVQAALEAVVPAQPKWQPPLDLLLAGLALRHDLLHAGVSPRASSAA